VVEKSLSIRDIAIIGNRRTAALLNRDGDIVWYCPGRFDSPSTFAGILDPQKGGAWSLELPRGCGKERQYIGSSAVLETRIHIDAGEFMITDWMPLGEGFPPAICRLLSAPPRQIDFLLSPRPNYGRDTVEFQRDSNAICIGGRHWLYASHPISIEHDKLRIAFPGGEAGWTMLADEPVSTVDEHAMHTWLNGTLEQWQVLAADIDYSGPFEREVAQSLRALRLMTHIPSGGIVAAATTSLPEVPGGDRNYDYRYVWLRDTGMIISALVRAGGHGVDARQFLEFVCASSQHTPGRPLLPPFLSLDHEPAKDEEYLDWDGYLGSRPVRIGNNANNQLQTDGFANVLLAAKLIYGRYGGREHWETVRDIADFLAAHWQEPDFGIWEEDCPRQYTAGKVIACSGLRYIADFAEDDAQAGRWRQAAQEIDSYIVRNCITPEGAYAVFAGSHAVDISAMLFPVWDYVGADSPEMLATVRVLERDYSNGNLYWRHLEQPGNRSEGAFLAGTLWAAQYWVMRKNLTRADEILRCALAYANDLGFLAEEADPDTGAMLGNLPQTFAHAALIGTVLDYRSAIENR